jgi:hypothetical protein
MPRTTSSSGPTSTGARWTTCSTAWDAEVPWLLASAHAAVGAKNEALLWLDRAIDRGMINYRFLSEHDRYLNNLRRDARFRELMGRAKREWERFAV